MGHSCAVTAAGAERGSLVAARRSRVICFEQYRRLIKEFAVIGLILNLKIGYALDQRVLRIFDRDIEGLDCRVRDEPRTEELHQFRCFVWRRCFAIFEFYKGVGAV